MISGHKKCRAAVIHAKAGIQSASQGGIWIAAFADFQECPRTAIEMDRTVAGLLNYRANSDPTQTFVPQRGHTTKPKAGRAPTGQACLG